MCLVPRKASVWLTTLSLVQFLGNGILYIVSLWHGEDNWWWLIWLNQANMNLKPEGIFRERGGCGNLQIMKSFSQQFVSSGWWKLIHLSLIETDVMESRISSTSNKLTLRLQNCNRWSPYAHKSRCIWSSTWDLSMQKPCIVQWNYGSIPYLRFIWTPCKRTRRPCV